MIKAGRYDLDEASLGRIYQHVVSNPKMKNWGVVTASRGELTPAENKQRNKELENDLRKMGYGFVHVDGMWQECRKPDTEYKDCPDDMKVPTEEKSLFIPNISQQHIQALGKKYQQDSVLFADEKTKANGEATFIVPVETVQVGSITVAVGTAGVMGCALVTVGVAALIQPDASFTVTE